MRTPYDIEQIAKAVTLFICIGEVWIFSLYQVQNILPVYRYEWGAEKYEVALYITQNTSTTQEGKN
jgi:hypothetical protein